MKKYIIPILLFLPSCASTPTLFSPPYPKFEGKTTEYTFQYRGGRVLSKATRNQILLRFIDKNNHLHVIHRGSDGTGYYIEGHWGQPISWRTTNPQYCFPISQLDVKEYLEEHNKTWIMEN